MEEREKSKPVVSVIIPVYNLENYLDTCLDSVGRQTYGDFEAIVVDDGSTDGSQAVALSHAERDARIVVISTVNQGLPGPVRRVSGMRRATTSVFSTATTSGIPACWRNWWRPSGKTAGTISYAAITNVFARPTKRPSAKCARRTCRGWISLLHRSTTLFP